MTTMKIIAEYKVKVRYYLTLRAGESAKLRAWDRCLTLADSLRAAGIDPQPILVEVQAEVEQERQQENLKKLS